MTTEDKYSPEITAAMAQWMNQTTRMWKDLLQTMPIPEPSAAPTEASVTEKTETAEEKKNTDSAQWDATFKTWRTFFESLAQPNPASMMGAQSVPPHLGELADASWQLFASMQQSLAEQLRRAGDQDHTEWLRPDEEALNQWSEFYEKEIRKYLTIPQIGLNKFSQEKFNNMIDRFHARQLALMEFFDLLSRPVKEGTSRMQKEFNRWIDTGQFPDDPKTIYRQWLKFVEGRYMVLFRSEEFLRSLQKALSTSFEFHNARKAVIEEVASDFSIPTSRDLDDVYRELHNLKQQVRVMESQLYEYAAQAASAANTA